MTEQTKLKVVVPPDVLEQLERDFEPQELQDLLNQIQQMADSGALLTESTPLDPHELEDDDPEMYATLLKKAQDAGYDDIDDWLSSVIDDNQPRLLN